MKHPEFIQKIDWKLLREQKLDMLYVITDIEENSQYANNDEEEENYKRWKNSLEGIIHLIDAIQDYAVEEMGLSEKDIFNLEEDGEVIKGT